MWEFILQALMSKLAKGDDGIVDKQMAKMMEGSGMPQGSGMPPVNDMMALSNDQNTGMDATNPGIMQPNPTGAPEEDLTGQPNFIDDWRKNIMGARQGINNFGQGMQSKLFGMLGF